MIDSAHPARLDAVGPATRCIPLGWVTVGYLFVGSAQSAQPPQCGPSDSAHLVRPIQLDSTHSVQSSLSGQLGSVYQRRPIQLGSLGLGLFGVAH